MNLTPTIILASQSKQRKTMLASMGIDFIAMPANLDELSIVAPTHQQRAQLLAETKVATIAKLLKERNQLNQRTIIVGADTYLVDQSGQALEKPVDLDEAKAMLRRQSGQQLVAITGAAAEVWQDQQRLEKTAGISEPVCTFMQLSEKQITHFAESELDILSWSGAFCPAYPTSAALIEKVDGSLSSFAYGFPVEFFAPIFKKYGLLV